MDSNHARGGFFSGCSHRLAKAAAGRFGRFRRDLDSLRLRLAVCGFIRGRRFCFRRRAARAVGGVLFLGIVGGGRANCRHGAFVERAVAPPLRNRDFARQNRGLANRGFRRGFFRRDIAPRRLGGRGFGRRRACFYFFRARRGGRDGADLADDFARSLPRRRPLQWRAVCADGAVCAARDFRFRRRCLTFRGGGADFAGAGFDAGDFARLLAVARRSRRLRQNGARSARCRWRSARPRRPARPVGLRRSLSLIRRSSKRSRKSNCRSRFCGGGWFSAKNAPAARSSASPSRRARFCSSSGLDFFAPAPAGRFFASPCLTWAILIGYNSDLAFLRGGGERFCFAGLFFAAAHNKSVFPLLSPNARRQSDSDKCRHSINWRASRAGASGLRPLRPL